MAQSVVNILLAFNSRTEAIQKAQRELNGINKHLKITRHFIERVAQINLGQVIVSGIPAAIRKGIAFNRVLQDTESSIRAIIAVSGGMSSISATTRATAVMGILRRRANETGGTIEALMSIFQRSVGLTQQSGIQLEGWADVVTEASVAAANLGIRAGELETYLRQIARGSVS